MPAWTQLILTTSQKYPIDYRFVGSSLIYHAREEAGEHLLKQGYDWLFFIDSDMTPPGDIILRLMEHDKPIVSAMAFKRDPPHEACFYETLEVEGDHSILKNFTEWDGSLTEVAGVGMACCLIKKEVFEQTPRPWFNPMLMLGEDLAFCYRARQAGFPIYVDTSITCGHIATHIITDVHCRAYQS